MVELLGIVTENGDTEFPLSEEDRLFADSFIRNKNLRSKILVSVHPGSSEPNKIWPIARYKELCHDLIKRGRKVILVGSLADQRLGEIISRDNPSVLNLIGKTSISQTAAIIEKCSVFIGNDSGPFHISIAVRTPTIGLIGGGYPRFHLYSREDIQIIKKAVGCAPCRNVNCKDKNCLTQIEENEVLNAAEAMLNKFEEDKIIAK
jgi:heptosyltransferase-2